MGRGRRGDFREARKGRYLRADLWPGARSDASLDIAATLQAALLRRSPDRSAGEMILREDLRRRVFQQRAARLIIFLVDASDSMGSGAVVRIRAAKGAVLGLLKTAYLQRDRVALVSFRERSARVLLQPTASIERARILLQGLAVGGATPLAAGLQEVERLARLARRRQPQLQPVLVVLSDGEANVPLRPGREIMQEVVELAGHLKAQSVGGVVVDSRSEPAASPLLKRLAGELDGSYHHIRELRARGLLQVVRAAAG